MSWPHTSSTLGQSHPLASDAAEEPDLPESAAGSLQLCQARRDGRESTLTLPVQRSARPAPFSNHASRFDPKFSGLLPFPLR